MRNVNESQVRAYLLTHGVIEGLNLEGVGVAEIRNRYNEVEHFVSILMDYGTMLSSAIDRLSADLEKDSAGANFAVFDSAAPAWLVARLLESEDLSVPSQAQWHHFSENLANAFYADKLKAFSDLDLDKQMRPGLEFEEKEPAYSERAIASALAKSCSGYSVGQVLEIIRKAPRGTTHLSLISKSVVYYMRAVASDMELWHNYTGNGWRPTHPLHNFSENLTSLESLKAVESIEPTASNQEERELMDPDLHFLNGEVPHVSGKLLGDEGVAREFSTQHVDPERIIPAGQHIPEQALARSVRAESTPLDPDREVTKPVISDVHELAVIQLGDVTITVDQLKKKVSIVAKSVELTVDEAFSLSGKLSV